MTFDVAKLSDNLKERCPEVTFAFLLGSARNGEVRPGGDIDLAVFLRGKPQWELYNRVADIVETLAPGAEPDLGVLNDAEPIYRFEALKGRLLFCRDREAYVDFFSLTCREYESQIADYERQREYRSTG